MRRLVRKLYERVFEKALMKELYDLQSIFYSPADPFLTSYRNFFHGQKCYLLGSGPSLEQAYDFDTSDGTVLAVNGAAFQENIPVDYFVSVGRVFVRTNHNAISKLPVKRAFLPSDFQSYFDTPPASTSWLNTVHEGHTGKNNSENHRGFSVRPNEYVYLGGTGTVVALQIIYWLGFSKVVLMGVDHQYSLPEEKLTAGRSKFLASELSGSYARGLVGYNPTDTRPLDLDRAQRSFDLALRYFEESNRILVNASPGSKLRNIPQVSIEEGLNL